jgi:hypothetical protein
MNNAVVNLWISPDGREYVIPMEIAAKTVWRKDGWPDKRVKTNAVFWDWLAQQEKPNARIEGQDAPSCPECGRVVGHYDDCSVGMGVLPPVREPVTNAMADKALEILSKAADPKAQAYAERVWNGQNRDIPRGERLDRVRRALEGQNLPFEGVVL